METIQCMLKLLSINFKVNLKMWEVNTFDIVLKIQGIIEPVHGISNNVVFATSKASDQPAHTRSLIRAFASRLSILRLLSY